MKRLNILQIYDYMKLGGAESHIITLTKALREKGHNVYVAGSAGPAVNILKRLSIPFFQLYPPEKGALMDNAGKIVEIIDQYDIDIIHAHPFQSQILASLVKLIRNIPIVTTIHGAYLTPSVTKLAEYIDHYIFVSPEVLDFHLNNSLLSNESYTVIPNCVEIEDIALENSQYLISGNTLKIVFVSRLDEDKLPSLLFFIESLEEIVRHMKVEVTIIGSGTQYVNISEEADKLNAKYAKEIIKVVNGSDNVKEYMKKADVVVGMGRVVLEALALGKIAICIGNRNYVGIVDKQKLEMISKVNYTDRNTNVPLDSKLLLEDLQKIININNDEQFKKEMLEVYEAVSRYNDVRLSAEEHEKIYMEVLRNFQINKNDINNLKAYRSEFPEIDAVISALELAQSGLSYQLDTTKSVRVLVKPDFYDVNDRWTEALAYLARNFECRDTTIVIRISNEYLNDIEDILTTISNVNNCLRTNYELDLLVDFLYQDEVDENLFLLEMNYFVLTNANQHKLIFKSELLGCKILRIIGDF